MSKPRQDKNIEVPDHILKQLLTQSEIRMLKNRFAIIKHLEEGLPIRNIAEKVKVGTDTVVRVARMMERMGIRKTLKGEEKFKTPFKTQTPWIFGKK